MNNHAIRLITVICLALAGTAKSHAGTTVPSVYSTGINDFYNPLSGDSLDFHYQLISVPAGSGFGNGTYLANVADAKVSGWANSGTSARWIAPATDISSMTSLKATGQYIYETKFNLDRFEANTAEISGLWAVDDSSDGILINDVPIGFARTGTSEFSTLQPFSITSGFLPGINSLKFIVNNLPGSDSINPTGLLVSMTATATPLVIVPEPLSIVSMIGGLTLLIIARKRFS